VSRPTRRWRLPRPQRCTVVRWGTVAMFALLALVAWADRADAHASLEATTPGDRSEVVTAPEQVEFRFNEEVSVAPGALRVYDRDGTRVDDSQQAQVAPDVVAVGLRDLDAGGYVATYLVTSADGHVIRGAITFQVGDGAAVDDATVAALFGSGDATIVAWLARLVTVVTMGGALVAIGALVPLRRAGSGRAQDAEPVGAALTGDTVGVDAAPEDPPHDGPGAGAEFVVATEFEAARTVARTAAVWGMVAAVAAIPVQAMAVSGQGLAALVSIEVMTEVLTSSVGLANLTMVAGLVGIVAAVRARRSRFREVASVALVVGGFLLAGHTMTVEPAWVMLAGDAVHVLAAAAWAGGLVVVVVTWRRVGATAPPVAVAGVVVRFSRIALWTMGAVALGGVAMTWALARQPRALVTTDWGWTLVVKVGLVAVILLVAAYNHWRLLPALAAADARGRAARDQLGTTMRVEVVLLVAVLAVTAVLTGLRPAAAEAGITGAFDTVATVTDDLSVNLVVDPNRAGANQVHLYLLDATGRPTSDVDEVTLELSQVAEDLGPIVRTPSPAGPGHWVLTGRDLAIPGPWEVTAVIAVDRFTEHRVTIDVVVNPG
jgi:copper transport protein